MDKKLSSKFDALQGLPSGLARQIVAVESRAKANKGKARINVHLEDAGTEFVSRLAGGRTPAPINPEKGGDREPSTKDADRPPRVSKAEKVKAWRAANPEAYAEQKKRNAEKQAAIRAIKKAEVTK